MSKTTEAAGEDLGPAGPAKHEARDLSRDEIFEVLSNRRRRFAIHHLQQHETETTLGSLVEHVAAWENDRPIEAVSAEERRRVYTSLQQFHLPKMDEKGIVDFDEQTGLVELDEAVEDVDIYLEVTEKHDLPWSVYYLGLAAISSIFVTLSWSGVPPFRHIPNAGWVVFLLTTLALFALAHIVLTRRMRVGGDGKPPEMKS